MLARSFSARHWSRCAGLWDPRFLAVYLISALAGSAAVMWPRAALQLGGPGASGAIFGMLGALLVITRKAGGNYQLVLVWLGINVVLTVVGGAGISWQGHLGGLLGGLAAAAILVLPARHHRRAGSGRADGVRLLLAVIVARVIMLR